MRDSVVVVDSARLESLLDVSRLNGTVSEVLAKESLSAVAHSMSCVAYYRNNLLHFLVILGGLRCCKSPLEALGQAFNGRQSLLRRRIL